MNLHLALSATGVKVGLVECVTAHPNGEHIKLAFVRFEKEGPPQQIIFGGQTKTVRKGSLVPVAPPTKSCRVRGRKMRRRKFRGHYSYGQLCSLFELGLVANDTNTVAIIQQQFHNNIGMTLENLFAELPNDATIWSVFEQEDNLHAV